MGSTQKRDTEHKVPVASIVPEKKTENKEKYNSVQAALGTVQHVAKQLKIQQTDMAMAMLRNWTDCTQRAEVTESLIKQINDLSDDNTTKALQNLMKPQFYLN